MHIILVKNRHLDMKHKVWLLVWYLHAINVRFILLQLIWQQTVEKTPQKSSQLLKSLFQRFDKFQRVLLAFMSHQIPAEFMKANPLHELFRDRNSSSISLWLLRHISSVHLRTH